jgi:hypothetical protein
MTMCPRENRLKWEFNLGFEETQRTNQKKAKEITEELINGKSKETRQAKKE